MTTCADGNELTEIQRLVRLCYVANEKYPNSDKKVIEMILEAQEGIVCVSITSLLANP